ncbi:MAG: phytanoyl-CoA dioxygenase family protein [Alphaproteobacteria bacterium]|jgi:ectoine hydroxylase-related dioxygenase (phytanoyl-CoA dioxygenase family)|nr:phytanoyl-CoA dioxygenase family protein [Alphaproteobacteria bacterium]
MALATATISETYAHDGFVFPIDVVSEAEARQIRDDLEAAEAELADDRDQLSILRSYPDRLLPSFDRLIRNPNLIDAVSPILGPDLMVWSAGLFIKEADTPHVVTWHQDLTYWGLDDVDEVTAWVALSPATIDSGCMRFVPGSHTRPVPHVDTFADDNLLSRGQEIAVEVDDSEGVDIVLRPGQASLHHGHLFHASGPNGTDDRRIGVAVRYITPAMKQTTGDRSLVALVSGEDRYGHFTIAGPPEGRMATADFERCRRDSEIKRRVLYDGVEAGKGRRYR